ncbi:hypothetical protein GCM10010363_06920 [Streptomyces omiyaensis]|nr:hypothetical protein GCM10010363_06920 [Streptomyces omiyaensis]
MIYRHFNAPSRAFTRFSHDIIRHPRLSSDAVRLLTWQLSLPRGVQESLSRTAERARIGSCAFTRAKRQLRDEGFVHERRVQGAGGRWVTQQLVSGSPLTADEAVKILTRTSLPACAERMVPQVAPNPRNQTAGVPAAGTPVRPPTGGHPKKEPGEKTSSRPTTTDAPREEPGNSPVREEASALIRALPLLSPALRYIPPGMCEELTQLATHWLAAGHTSADLHAHILRGLPGAGTPVRRPGGLVRYLLREVAPRHSSGPLPPPDPAAPLRGPRLSARLTGARECSGDHVQPMLFRPLSDETLCPRCVREP